MNKYKLSKYQYKYEVLEGGLRCPSSIGKTDVIVLYQKYKYDINTSSGQTIFSKRVNGTLVMIGYDLDENNNKRQLGKGSFGTVYLGNMRAVTEKIPSKIAIKLMPNIDENMELDICSELYSLMNVEHVGIVKYIGFSPEYPIKGYPSYYIFMEYLNGKDLNKYISAPLNKKKEIMYQLLDTLHYLHKNNVYHRDIKPENIYVIEDATTGKLTTKYIDFGFSCVFGKSCDENTHSRGTPYYMSPEQMRYMIVKLSQTGSLSLTSSIKMDGEYMTNNRTIYYRYHDMWALGHTLYMLFTGKNIHAGAKNMNDLYNRLNTIDQRSVDDIINNDLSFDKDVLRIVGNLMKIDYNKRIIETTTSNVGTLSANEPYIADILKSYDQPIAQALYISNLGNNPPALKNTISPVDLRGSTK